MTIRVQEYFSESARRHPDRLAVACRDERVTYGELEARSNAHARALRERGLARGAFVPFFMAKGVRAIESILSILKADCAYVPLDAASPAGRLEDILDATAARFVLVDAEGARRLRERVPDADARFVLWDVEGDPGASEAPVECENLSIDLAYVLFTSGSTGRPKGVMISHQMIVDYIDWCVDTYALTGADVIANHAPLHFDNSTFDLYTAFKTGAPLHLVHDELNVLPVKLLPWLRQRGITTFFCVPSVLMLLLRSGRLEPGSLPALRHVIAAGEVLPPDVLDAWMERLPGVQFTNMYGPTEITVDCTFHVVSERPGPDATPIPIGRPRRNMEVFVRREDGTLSKAPGDEGEIVVRGASVAYGYLGDPERTRAAFVQNPRHDLFHDPLYRTGDLARIDADGSFLYLGRGDQQIKYMGNRIELGEIEAALRRVDGVDDAVVVFRDAPAMQDKAIGALVCLRPGASRASLRAALEASLPGYMVPRRIEVTEGDLPRTPNGKTDRRTALEVVFPTN